MVIAPLANVIELGNFTLFRSQLAKLKAIGVDAVSTDVWWHHFQPSEDTWDWKYYLQYVDAINASGLKWVPIISLHWVPDWIWRKYPDSWFVNEYDESSNMYMSFWHPQTRSLIASAIDRFFETFAEYDQTIYGVYVAAGMWGELHYPWMLNTQEARWAYYGYDQNAKIDFSDQMKTKYIIIENANAAWETTYQNWSQVEPPLPSTTNPELWHDFLWWYNSTLVKFEDWLLNTTRQSFSGLTLIKLSMVSDPAYDQMLGHLDYDAIFSIFAKYDAIPTCTCSEDPEVTSKFASLSRKYNLKHWGENAGIGAELNTVLNDLIIYGYDVFSYFKMDDLFQIDAKTDLPTARFYDFAKSVIKFESTIRVPYDYLTIQEAVNAANDGDTVYVKNGTYFENLVINKSLTLTGENRELTIIDGSGNGEIAYIQADNVCINNFTLQNAGFGAYGAIWIEGPFSNAMICNNTMIDNRHGVAVFSGAFNVTISNNLIFNKQPRYADGIRLFSSGTIVVGNVAINESTAIGLDSAHNNIVTNNTVINNYIGIGAGNQSYDNVFSENTIANNSYGLKTTLYNSKFFHNNIVDNSVQTFFYSTDYANAWDDGYPSGGNYWSDYNGTDLFLGSAQNETGSDGIVDTPYFIDANSTDHYPLKNPWTPLDIGLMALSTSKSTIGQGYVASVNVTVVNQSNKIEAFNFTVCANESVIYSDRLLLAMTSLTTIFNWNTTGFRYGNYIISTFAKSLSDETGVPGNNWTGTVPVHVGFPGDISGPTQGVYDGTCNMRDINYLILLFNTNPGSSNWKPNADINDDGTVNMRDIQIAILNFNKHE